MPPNAFGREPVLSDLLPGGHAGADVLAFFKWIDLHVARNFDVHLVLDNLSAHKSEPDPKRKRWHLQ